ncbi:hypothetical protein EHR01_10145 [Leptospira mtsangambouensis]|uniref:Uncharacterized protein n=1 Tax=Leptospira mtsangambouensis TaxID=2484912 RepID=A0ABY2NZE2_9LEPT|nr:hypothetical protein EHR01_10145 [Leptospira mtsangambouensis]
MLGLRHIPFLAFACKRQALCQSLTSPWDSGSGNVGKPSSLYAISAKSFAQPSWPRQYYE